MAHFFIIFLLHDITKLVKLVTHLLGKQSDFSFHYEIHVY